MNLNHFEIKLLQDLSDGLSQKEIAGKYNVSKTNVNNFLRRARRKTNSRTTIHLVVEAHKKKLIA